MMMSAISDDLYAELAYYTLAHANPGYFIHQHFVDAYFAQTAGASAKPLGLTFALAGLCLFVEQGYSGRQVQLAHMQMAKNKVWPTIRLPQQRGEITITHVLKAPAGEARDAMIKKWCVSVWEAYSDSH